MVDQVVEIEGYSKVSVPESYWHVVCSAAVDLLNRSDMLTTESRDAKLGSSVPPLARSGAQFRFTRNSAFGLHEFYNVWLFSNCRTEEVPARQNGVSRGSTGGPESGNHKVKTKGEPCPCSRALSRLKFR